MRLFYVYRIANTMHTHIRFDYTLDFSGEIAAEVCEIACGRGYMKV